jgi:gliding motility-associated-like protein
LRNPREACKGTTALFDAKPANIDMPDAKYVWTKDGKLLPDNTSSIEVIADEKGIGSYTVTFSFPDGGCVTKDSVKLTFINPPITDMADTIKACLEDGPGKLDAGPGASYVWITPGIENPTQTEKTYNVGEQKYYVVDVYNEKGCATRDSIYFKDICPPRLYAPTAFIPDGDVEKDRYFQVFGRFVANFKITIFNRWGEIIFYSEDPNFKWDGTYRGEPMPIGVYPWTITYGAQYSEFQRTQKMDGAVTIIR